MLWIAAAAAFTIFALAITITLVISGNAQANRLADAVERCGVKASALSGDGSAVFFEAVGLEGSADPSDVLCVLDAVGAPDSIRAKIASTRALDGTRESSWDGYSAQWTYHPDDGLNFLLERVD